MKASKSTLVMLATLALGGCVAQAGTTEDPSSAEQDLNAPAVVQTTGAQKREPSSEHTKQLLRDDGQPAKVSGAELTAPVDPSTSSQDEGDGQEPVPHPWVPRTTFTHH